MTTVSAPSFGVLVASVIGNVLPPLVESKIFTVAALTGAAVVSATFQVTVRDPDHVTPAAGAVTVNGPAACTTVTCVSAEFTPPPPARLSRAVTRKFIVRFVVGSFSPATLVPVRMLDNLG